MQVYIVYICILQVDILYVFMSVISDLLRKSLFTANQLAEDGKYEVYLYNMEKLSFWREQVSQLSQLCTLLFGNCWFDRSWARLDDHWFVDPIVWLENNELVQVMGLSWFKNEGDFGTPPTSKSKKKHGFTGLGRVPNQGDLKRLCDFLDMCIPVTSVTCDMLALNYLFVGPQEASNIQPTDLTPRTKEWETIVVDEFVPCNVSCGQPRPAFARPLGEEIWVLLLLGVSQLYRRPKSILKKLVDITGFKDSTFWYVQNKANSEHMVSWVW